MKYNIPARTLRDWMKRLNIKSVFTHNHSTSSSSTSSSNQNQSKNSETNSTTDKKANISVTSVELPESTITIKDIIKLQNTNCIANPDGVVNGAKNNVVDGQEIDRSAIKIENDADNIVSNKIENFL